MNLHLGVLQKPDRLNIGKAPVPAVHQLATPAVNQLATPAVNQLATPPGIPEDVFARLHPDIQKNFSTITEILRKHAKVPQWAESGESISIRCNFAHVFRLTAADVMNSKVRCPACRIHAEEIFKEIYDKKQINTEVFEIRRINKFGQLSLRCVKSDHKLQIAAGADFNYEVPDCCPECIVDSELEASPFVMPSDMAMAVRLQELNTRKRSAYDEIDFDRFMQVPEYVDSDPEFGSYKMNPPGYQSDLDDYASPEFGDLDKGYSSPDLDLISDIDDEHSPLHSPRDSSLRSSLRSSLHSPRHLPRHSLLHSPRHSRGNSDRCCSDVDDAYANYFDDPADSDDPADPYKSLERLFIQYADEYDACKARACG
jgi:hypothetical protein